jgi:acyl carrier protein|tara:strand:- start:249 stop:488 length:240 start_codon:yes stop_codon:yes gene_type:complete
MENKLKKAFSQSLGIPIEEIIDSLEYNSRDEWDSVAHMSLVASIEDTFDIMMDTDDIIDMSSVGKAKEILVNYGIEFDA